jgi:opacity protein-like surface antigen
MKLANSKVILSLGALALSLAVMPALPVAAQNSSDAPTVDTTPFQESDSDFNNFGWLGALGLLGLANLFRKPTRRDETPDRTETYPGSSHGENPVTRPDQR